MILAVEGAIAFANRFYQTTDTSVSGTEKSKRIIHCVILCMHQESHYSSIFYIALGLFVTLSEYLDFLDFSKI